MNFLKMQSTAENRNQNEEMDIDSLFEKVSRVVLGLA